MKLILYYFIIFFVASISYEQLLGTTGIGPTSKNKLGPVIVNPYKIAPLTAIINRAGKDISDVEVTVLPKEGGIELQYTVSKHALMTHDGIPIFGLYPDYKNSVKVKYILNGKTISEVYTIYTNPIQGLEVANRSSNIPKFIPVKTTKELQARLYLVNLINTDYTSILNWNTPGGSLTFNSPSENYIIDINGDIRWCLDPKYFFDKEGYDITKQGTMMSFHQVDNGEFIFTKGQMYYRYDMLGRKIFERKLPEGYIDASHEIIQLNNGHYMIKVGKANYLRSDSKYVNTIRDHIIELSSSGTIFDVWDLNKILDPTRDVLLKAINPNAVCLNINLSTQEQFVIPDAPFGDITGIEPGRNWAHTNSIYYDDTDDSIIVSLRHQGVAKISRDKKVKWILSSPEGWKGDLTSKILIPVDSKGNKIACVNSKCDGNFDWPWTQHTAYYNPEIGEHILSVFDNGDARGMVQPPFLTDKYSRAVVYKIDEKKMTVQQLWEYGKERGYDWFSQVTGNVNYIPATKTWLVFTGNVYLMEPDKANVGYIDELKVINNKPKLISEIKIEFTGPLNLGYRTSVFNKDNFFNY